MRWPLGVIGVLLLSSTALAQQTTTVTAGPEYAASHTQERWFGDGYRDIWTTPFVAPVLDLSTEAGGLQPVRQVGGLQTAGLALRGADGKSYTFRSLRKEPERLLPPEWRNSWPAKMLRDATSATHPGAAVILPVLAEAAEIPHTQPRLVVMPDDPRLGTFRATFANQLGTFEEFPTGSANGGFHEATEIISTADLWPRWLRGPENRIDSRAFLRARILDLFVENYDRRRGQWRWMRLPGQPAWEPLPEDPDMAFVRHNGLAMAAMRERQPRLLNFSDKYSSRLEGPTSNAAEVDRWLLTDLEGPVFEQLARELQAAWTDEVIDRAVAQLPKEWQTVDGGALGRTLRARRAGLVAYVKRFYLYMATVVDIQLTDMDERVAIRAGEDRAVAVEVSALGGGAPYYSRRFLPSETDEIRIYLHGGNDRVERSGASSGIHVRIVGGGGEKTVTSANATSEVWADAGTFTGAKVHESGPWTNPDPVANAPWLEPRNFGSVTFWQPSGWYATDVGLVLGASVTRTTYGFRSMPAAKEQTISGGWAFGEASGKLQYDVTTHRPASNLGFAVRAFASGIEQINYYGFGNETPAESDRARYHSKETVLLFAPGIRLGSSARWSITLGPEIRYSNSGTTEGSILAEQAPYGTDRFGLVAIRAGVELGPRPVAGAGFMATAMSGVTGEAPDQPPGRGVRAATSVFVTPAAWDTLTTYGGFEGFVSGFVGGDSLQFAARVGGRRLFGEYPWFDAAFIGGRNDRAYHSHRFAGDGSLYGNMELRAYLGPPLSASVFPVRFGLVGFADIGRTWLEGETSQRWHPTVGGGVLLKPVGTGIVLRAVLAYGSEGTLFSLGSGFRF